MTRTKSATDPAFAELVKADVFGGTTPGEMAELRSPEKLEIFLLELTRVAQSVQDQLTNHNDGTLPREGTWRADASAVHKRYSKRLAEVKRLVQEQRTRWNAFDPVALSAEMARLRGAIRAHADASADSGVEPEEWDLVLWGHVEGAT